MQSVQLKAAKRVKILGNADNCNGVLSSNTPVMMTEYGVTY